MRGTLSVTRRLCPQCGTPTKFERNATVWGAGDLIMILMTVLLWLPLKLGWNALTNPWRCAACGSKT